MAEIRELSQEEKYLLYKEPLPKEAIGSRFEVNGIEYGVFAGSGLLIGVATVDEEVRIRPVDNSKLHYADVFFWFNRHWSHNPAFSFDGTLRSALINEQERTAYNVETSRKLVKQYDEAMEQLELKKKWTMPLQLELPKNKVLDELTEESQKLGLF